MANDEKYSHDFIREIINKDLKTKKNDSRVHTRFPPEPNGHLHVGHAKSICLNFGIAEEYNGKCNLRFDDTNPIKEGDEYVKSIIDDVGWLGFDWEDRIYYASDYFPQMYNYAIVLIKSGKAYVDDQNANEISYNRGTVNKSGKNSPYRDRSIEENLELFELMKKGYFKDGEKVLRAKIDMSHPNMNMRDPVMYRILHAYHHRTKDEWCIYPMYDWAHGLEDSIEKITHSICTLEFENHRPLYDWFLKELKIFQPQQIEFARLNLTYTVMSKRMLLELVNKNYVNGWDDPRLPTIKGMKRRGYSPASIRDFCRRIGVAKVNSNIPVDFLEHCVRENLNKTVPRFMGVLRPLKITIENYPNDLIDDMNVINNPEDANAGIRKVPFSKSLYIEQDDFMEYPSKKFYRLAPGREVRLVNAYFLKCNDVIKEGEITKELTCTIDHNTKGGNSPDGRKVKSTIHWVSLQKAIDAEVRLYDRLFTIENPTGKKGQDYKDFINSNSLKILKNCKIESAVSELKPFDRFQFLRKGYFCIDPDKNDKKLVINQTVELRDKWSKIKNN
ncbi:MAG: glutamine--tRNA ligase/YqeY domain fusion protein [Candidatus Thermoplasmatota archaeon]|nr:glutamine--tRNA ligase/YqeY domain fusion protein [Candidatus Thermoplasmatota archaeon]